MERTLLGIIGHNISYTLSPAMHSEAIRVLGLPYTYGVFDVAGEMLPGLVLSLRSDRVRGANVTKPHKEAMLPFMDELSDEARVLGAVNTIINTDGVLRGENTDVDGVRASLTPHRKAIVGGDVLVMGAGGASRAVLYAAAECAPRKITIANRNYQRALVAAETFGRLFPQVSFCALTFEDAARTADESVLIVNTTTVGMAPGITESPIPEGVRFSTEQIIFDIIYTPLRTALLQRAETDGAAIIDGMEMFIQQGARSFSMWTGRRFPAKEARERVLRELGKH